MKQLPKSDAYVRELQYIPWGKLTKKILSRITNHAPNNGTVIDLMCGPGVLLGQIAEQRPDLQLCGIDNNGEFISYARHMYSHINFANSNINFELADVTSWNSTKKFDYVLCTAGVHHLPYDIQPAFLHKLSKLTERKGKCIIADPFIDNYSTEVERKRAAAKLGYAKVDVAISNDAPDDIVETMLDVMHNDVLKHEYKTSIEKRTAILSTLFMEIETNKVWGKTCIGRNGYGDYYQVCTGPMQGD